MLKYKNIIFDFDSTLTTLEGLDEIAKRRGVLTQVQEITSAGMNGSLPFSQSIRKRLKIIQPKKEDFEWLANKYRRYLIKGAKKLIKQIIKAGGTIYLVTGGPRPAVEKLGLELGIARENIYAACLDLNKYGYLDADNNCLMTSDQGKIAMVKKIKKTGSTVMIGDGMTDCLAGEHADLFIGFGGVVKRESVKSKSKIYVEDPNLLNLLKYLNP